MRYEYLRPLVQRVLGGVVALAVAGFCGYSLAAAQAWFAPASQVADLDRADDPVHNGLVIVETPRKPQVLPRRADNADESPVILLDEWTYTSKGKPSPYQ
jgi:hypothetical protein